MLAPLYTLVKVQLVKCCSGKRSAVNRMIVLFKVHEKADMPEELRQVQEANTNRRDEIRF